MFKAIKRVKKMGPIALLIIAQLTLSLGMINTSGKLFEDSQNRKKGIDKLFNINQTTYVKIFPLGGYEKENESLWSTYLKSKDAGNIYELLKRNGTIKDYYIYSSSPNIHEVFEKDLPSKYKDLSDLSKSVYIGEIIINDNFLKHYDFKISKGRNLVPEDFNKDYKKENIPILIGKDFDGPYKLGQTFKIKDSSRAERISKIDADIKEDFLTFEIVGFLDNNSIPINDGPAELFASSFFYSDAIKVIPLINDFAAYDFFLHTLDRGIFFERNSTVSESKLVEMLNTELNKNGLEARLYPLSNTTTILENYDRDVKSSLSLGGLLLILSIVGASSIILGQLKKRKKEFGIKIAMGSTINDIAKDIILEVLIMTLISIIISLLLNIKMGIGLSIVLINIGLLSIITLLISIFPVLEIKKLSVVELVKEK